MESRQRIGLYGSGEVPRPRRLWSRSPGPESLGLKDIRQLPPIRRVRPANKTKAIATTAMISLATVIVIVSAFALTPSMEEYQRGQTFAPITPYPCIGIVFNSLGAPQPGASINITDLTTGLFNNSLVSETTPGSEGYYVFDLNTLGGGAPVNPGDIFRIVANDTAMIGTNETVIPVVFEGFIWFNVTLNATIPEFAALVIPVMGVLGLVLTMVLVARVRDE